MDEPTLVPVHDPSGTEAMLERPAEDAERAVLRLPSGSRVELPTDLLRRLDDGSYRCTIAFDALAEAGERVTIPLVEERLAVGKRVRETGRVRLSKHVETHEEIVDEPLLREEVEVERVPVGRYVDEPATVRQDGETTIIPVLEEVLVVEKRLLLKEELHVTKRQTEARDPQRVRLRKERVEVERLTSNLDDPDEAPES